jgi:hypothetical protein
VAGTPFRMSYHLRYSAAEAGAEISGVFHFVGLPVGAGIRSCNGYNQDYVATRAATWGRVKALYR